MKLALSADISLPIDSLTSIDFAISQDYQFNIVTLTETKLDIKSLLGTSGKIILEQHQQKNYIHVYIRTIKYFGKKIDCYQYEIQCRSPIYPLKHSQHSRIFLKKTVIEIISDVLKNNSLMNYDFILNHKYEPIDQKSQYNETDFDFFHELIQRYSLTYLIEHFENTFKLIISDDLSNIPNKTHDFTYYEAHGFNQNTNALTNLIYFSNTASSLPSQKEYYEFNISDLLVSLNDFININDKHITYRIIKLNYYKNNDVFSILATAVLSNYIIGGLNVKENLIAKPTNLISLTLAKTETPFENNDIPFIDGYGRYFLSFYFDDLEKPKGRGSKPIARIYHYSGNKKFAPKDAYGWYSPLYPNTDVLVVFQNNDINKPYILGTIANPITPNPVTLENHQQYIFRTPAGHNLIFDDNTENPFINLATYSNKNILQLNSTGKNGVLLKSGEGKVSLCAESNILFNSQSSFIHVKNIYQSSVSGDFHLQSQNGSQYFHAGNNITLNSNQNVVINSVDFKISSGKDYIENIQGNFLKRIISGDYVCHVKNCRSIFYAKKIVMGANIMIGNSKASIRILDDQLNISAENITFEAEEIEIYGDVRWA